ncbi:hypothetical protein [Streptosporangium sp. NPDC003464]
MVEVDSKALEKAAKEFVDALLPIAESIKTLADGTHLSPLAWGPIGAVTVANNYNPAQEYQSKQADGFVNSLNGIKAGLLSVVIHYMEANLASAKQSAETEKIIDLQARLETNKSFLEEAKKKNQGLTD